MENSQQGAGGAILSTVVDTAKTMVPAIIAAGIAANPETAQINAVAQIAANLLQSAVQAHNAGLLTSQELSDLFVKNGERLKSTEDAWLAMNLQDAKAAS